MPSLGPSSLSPFRSRANARVRARASSSMARKVLASGPAADVITDGFCYSANQEFIVIIQFKGGYSLSAECATNGTTRVSRAERQ